MPGAAAALPGQQQGGDGVQRGAAVVVGLGDPVMDVLFDVDPHVLASIADKPGGCIPIQHDELVRLTAVAAEHCTPARIPGGSAANVMKGLANLSGGRARCTFGGMVGRDSTAVEYRQMLQQQGVEPLLLESDAGPTASCLCFVTPDGQRTMRTCLGASGHLRAATQLPQGWCSGAHLLHCEGYCLYKPQLAREAMAAAKQAGAQVSLDLASFECVQNCSSTLLELLKAGLIDLVFANEDEACALLDVLAAAGDAAAAGPGGATVAAASAGPDAAARVEAAQRFVLQHAQVCVVSLGARGCVARARDGSVARAPAGGVKVVDTIGAGDCFTAGFLYAHLLGCSIAQCASVGCQAGSEAVRVKGSLLSEDAWQGLRSRVEEVVGDAAASAGMRAAAGSGASAGAVGARAGVGAPAAGRKQQAEPAAGGVGDAACVLTPA